MNLSKTARAVAVPSLRIDQPDCRRAAHASSVGPIDETQLFYLESRGSGARSSQIHRPRLPRAGRRPRRSTSRASGCAGRSRRWAAGFGEGSLGGVSRRIDLLGVEELPEGDATGLGGRHGCRPGHPLERRVPRAPGHLQPRVFELDKGFLTAGTLTYALHLSRFDITDGEPLDPPAELPLAVYEVVVEDGRVQIEVPDGPLEMGR